jgi:hypothetical protein
LFDADREKTALWLEKSSRILVASAAVAAVYVLVIQALVHFPYYDESMHMRQLWRISTGMRPGVDYFSSYPALAYLFLSPVLKLFPETAYVLLVFRFVSILLFIAVGALVYFHGKRVAEDREAALLPLILLASTDAMGSFFVEFSIDHYAALAAVGAMALLFQAPEVRKAALASALAFLSLLITPKYAFPVFFGFLGYLSSACLTDKNTKKLIAGIAAGAAAAVILTSLVFWTYDISLIDNIKTSHLLAPRMVMAKDWDYLALAIFDTFKYEPLYGAIALLGIAGWAKRSLGSRDTVSLTGAGILLGIIVHCFRIKFHLEQYQAPVYLSLALLAPFAFYGLWRDMAAKVIKVALSIAALVAITVQIPAVHREFDRTAMNFRETGLEGEELVPPFIKILPYYDKLLEVIPKEEKIVALWCNNPLFRMDVTGVLGDDRPSFSELLEKDDPLQRFFNPEYLKAELEKKPPALIDFFMLQDNYPRGWENILWDYVAKNSDNYRVAVSPVDSRIKMALRADLADKWKTLFPDYPPYPLIP